MAPAVADAVAALDNIKPPQGVVLPPKEIKGMFPSKYSGKIRANVPTAILEKTAGYVARNGLAFEGVLSDIPLRSFHINAN